MVFNIAAAALVYQSYQQNASGTYINQPELGLAITEMALICITYIGYMVCALLGKCRDKDLLTYLLFYITVQVYNVAYSAYIIEYYNTQTLVSPSLNNMSLAIIILNSVSMVGFRCFVVDNDD